MNPKDVIAEIMETAFKLSMENDRIIGLFRKSGVVVEDSKVVGFEGEPIAVLKSLMENLSSMAVIKISAKQIIRKSGISLF